MKKIIFFYLIFHITSICFFAPHVLAEEKKIVEIINQIKQSSQQPTDFSALVTQSQNMNFMEIQLNGPIYFKKPNKFRAEFNMTGMDGGYNMNSLTIFDGQIMWQVQISPQGKVLNVLKFALNKSTPMHEIIPKQTRIDPASQIERLLEEYEVKDIKEDTFDNHHVYILDLKLKPDKKDRMQRMMTALGMTESEHLIPEQVLCFWDKDAGHCQKIESYNTKQVLVSKIEYKDIKVDSGLSDELFKYTPSDGVSVIDMTQMMEDMQGTMEKEGRENDLAGKSCPEFTLSDLSGNEYSNGDLVGKVSIIDFWASWCGPCRKELPLIENLYQHLKDDNQIVLLTVSNEEKDEVRSFVKKNNYTFPVLIDRDNEFSNNLKVNSIPRIFVIDKALKISRVYIGYHEDIDKILKQDIDELKNR